MSEVRHRARAIGCKISREICAVVLLMLTTLVGCNQDRDFKASKAERVQSQESRAANNSEGIPTQEVTTSSAAQPGDKILRGSYINYEYGYGVMIPKGLAAHTDPPPSPQHGFNITLVKEPEAKISIDGTYDASDYGSLDAAVDAHIEWMKRKTSQLEIVSRSQTKLASLAAMRLTVRYSDKQSSEMMIKDAIIAIRDRGEEEGIMYEVSLTTPESRYEKDKQTFDQIVGTWKLQPLPR